METEKRSFIKWVKVHKNELIIAGVSVAAIVAIILGCKSRKELLTLWSAIEEEIKKVPQCQVQVITTPAVDVFKAEPSAVVPELIPCVISEIPQEIKSHIRNLPEGWNASAEKVATAAENGYSLLPGQTWVGSYTKNRIAA